MKTRARIVEKLRRYGIQMPMKATVPNTAVIEFLRRRSKKPAGETLDLERIRAMEKIVRDKRVPVAKKLEEIRVVLAYQSISLAESRRGLKELCRACRLNEKKLIAGWLKHGYLSEQTIEEIKRQLKSHSNRGAIGIAQNILLLMAQAELAKKTILELNAMLRGAKKE